MVKRLDFCLGVTGFVNPPIGKVLAFDAAHDVVGALCIVEAELGAAVIAEVEFGEVAVQNEPLALMRAA